MPRLLTSGLAGMLFLTLAAPVAGAEESLRLSSLQPRLSATVRFQEKTPIEPSPKKSFFKTRRGILIVSLSAIAVSYTLWSKQHDRVHSPVR
jgi:hypothetical protein